MRAYLLDTSAIVKHYVPEPGSAWVQRLISSGAPIFLAEISLVEVATALSILYRQRILRKSRRDLLWGQFEHDAVTTYRWISMQRSVIYSAALLGLRHPLKAYDAVQIAAAQSLQEDLKQQGVDLVFVSGDDQALTAAQAEGIAVENPFWHQEQDGTHS